MSPPSPREEAINPHEEALIRAFISRDTRDQFLRRVANPRTRKKLFVKLAHFEDLDPSFAHRLTGYQAPDTIYRLLKERGAPKTCHVMGVSRLDGQDVDLREALDDMDEHAWGSFLSCIPGRLGYFQGENPGERYLLER